MAKSISQQLFGRQIFYGWAIVVIIFITSMITAGISGYGLSFFILPMSEDLGVSRAEFSLITLFRLVPLPLVPLLGLLVDKKHGARLLLSVGAILAGLTLIATSQVQTIWHFYLAYGVIFSAAMFTMGGMLVGPSVLAKWFIKRRGRVMAISAIGISGGGLIIAPVAGWLIGEFGWRPTWIVLGFFMIFSISPLSAIFMRRQPEDIGLLPDGETQDQTASSPESTGSRIWADTEYAWTVRQALRTRVMWILIGVQTLGGIALMPTLFHQVAYIQDKGFSLQQAATVATTLAGFAILGKLLYGFLAEKFPIHWILALSLAPAGLSLFLLIGAQKILTLYAYAVLHGLTMGGWPPLMNVAWAAYFGRKHMGAIRGVVTPVGNIVGAFSPVFAAWAWENLGSYDFPFSVFALAWIIGGILVLFSTTPQPPVLVAVEKTPSP